MTENTHISKKRNIAKPEKEAQETAKLKSLKIHQDNDVKTDNIKLKKSKILRKSVQKVFQGGNSKAEKEVTENDNLKVKTTPKIQNSGQDIPAVKNKKKKSKNLKKTIEKVVQNDDLKSKDGLTPEAIAKIEKKKKKKLAKLLKKKNKKLEITGAIENQNLVESNDGSIDAGENAKSIVSEKVMDYANLKDATVFVGNLPVNTKRVQVQRLFQDYGPVRTIRFRSAGGKVLFKHKHRKDAGSLNAYVVLKDKKAAASAVKLNGCEFKNNHLRITLSQAPNDNVNNAKRTIFVGNLKYSATDELLHEIFSGCGEIEYVRCLRDGDKGCKGVAYICFKKPESVGLALELNGTVVDNRPINIERYSVNKLGAKAARDIIDENKKVIKTRNSQKKQSKKSETTSKKENQVMTNKKKKNFHGVKAGNVVKKKSPKKINNKMQQLAKKIAPKLKNAAQN